jgi:hypothetical protein
MRIAKPDFGLSRTSPHFARPVAQPLLFTLLVPSFEGSIEATVLFGVNKGNTCSPEPSIAIAFLCIR